MRMQMRGLAAAFVCAAGLLAAGQDPPAPQTPAPVSSGPMARLRADLATAVKNGKLTDAQKKTLEGAGAKLREAGEARQRGGKVDRGAVKKALGEIRKVAGSGAFQPVDAAAVKADLDALRELGGGQRRRRLRR